MKTFALLLCLANAVMWVRVSWVIALLWVGAAIFVVRVGRVHSEARLMGGARR